MEFGLLDKIRHDNILSWIGKKNHTLTRIYQGTKDGLTAADFHRLCDNKGPTVVVVQGTNNYIFGGYTAQSWDTSNQYKADPQSFLFHLGNNGAGYQIQQFKYQTTLVGIYSYNNLGPYFCCQQAGQYEFAVFPGNDTFTVTHRGGYWSGNSCTAFCGVGSSGRGNISEVEVYTVCDKKDVAVKEKTKVQVVGMWRKVVKDWSEKVCDGMKGEIAAYKPTEELGLDYVNILLLGPVGGGKSSFFNTVNSVFRGYVTAQAGTGSGSSGLTNKFRRYEVRNRSGPGGGKLKLRLCDTLGFADNQGLDIPDIPYLLNGNIPDRFQFNTLAPITPESHGFIDQPSFGEKMHVVAFVLNAKEIDEMSDKIAEKLKAARTQAHARGIPLVVLLTHSDLILEETDKLNSIFTSGAVYAAVESAASKLGVPKGHVLPVVNYENEVELDIHRDLLALLAVRQILRSADGYFDDQVDAGNCQPKPGKKKANKTRAEAIDQPN